MYWIQHLSFPKFSGGDVPGPSQREGATPFRTQHSARPWPGAAPRCWDPNLGPPKLFSRGCAPGHVSLSTACRLMTLTRDQWWSWQLLTNNFKTNAC